MKVLSRKKRLSFFKDDETVLWETERSTAEIETIA